MLTRPAGLCPVAAPYGHIRGGGRESVSEIDALRGTFRVQELGASTRNRSAQSAPIYSSAELLE
jgi:hypothetical protein